MYFKMEDCTHYGYNNYCWMLYPDIFSYLDTLSFLGLIVTCTLCYFSQEVADVMK